MSIEVVCPKEVAKSLEVDRIRTLDYFIKQINRKLSQGNKFINLDYDKSPNFYYNFRDRCAIENINEYIGDIIQLYSRCWDVKYTNNPPTEKYNKVLGWIFSLVGLSTETDGEHFLIFTEKSNV